ncbi:MAG TPA: hypothetical protein VH415_12080 [Nitrososphaeraceae archaeon]|jgi:hypothetical protein
MKVKAYCSKRAFLIQTGIFISTMILFLVNYEVDVASAIWIKIISPHAGDRVDVGELTIKGISSDNVTSDCQAYVDWNNRKPYQPVIATGPGGFDDYSNWTFTYNSSYHLIQEGINDLTSKLACAGSPLNPLSMNKWYSINITGVSSGGDDGVDFPLPTQALDNDDEDNSVGSPSTQSADETDNLIQLDVSVSNNPIAAGSEQTITVEAIDPSSREKVSDAQISVTIADPSGTIVKQFDTDDGDLTRSFDTDESALGSFTVTANAQSEIGSASKSINFDVQ